MLVIGLTGGIGSGKTTVANLFANLGIEIIDADIIARKMVTPNTHPYQQIVRHFGPSILLKDGTLNREKLRKIIFSNSEDKKWLENLLHPLILKKISLLAKESKSPYLIVVIPLLLETKQQKMVDRILVIEATKKQQIARATKRDKVSAEEVESIIATQATSQERLKNADDIIYNNGSLEALQEEVSLLHKKYLKLSVVV